MVPLIDQAAFMGVEDQGYASAKAILPLLAGQLDYHRTSPSERKSQSYGERVRLKGR